MEAQGDIQKPIFMEATKQVKNMEDLKKWEKSEAYQEYLGKDLLRNGRKASLNLLL